MARKNMRLTRKNGKMVHSPNPQRPVFILQPTTEVPVTPISKKNASAVANGVPLPKVKGVFVSTTGGRRIIYKPQQKGIIKYTYALV